MDRKPEFHLYLYTLEGYKRDVINAYTVTAVNDRITLGKDVDTYQVICCTTDLFNKGYRIFIHETPASQFEITLGTCEGTTREIKMGHDLPKLILAGEFTYEDPNTIPYKDFHVPDFYEDGFPPTVIPPEKLLDQTEIQEIREIAESIKNIVSEYKNQYADDDPDTAIWGLYEQAYPNNNGLPDISYMGGREDVVNNG